MVSMDEKGKSRRKRLRKKSDYDTTSTGTGGGTSTLPHVHHSDAPKVQSTAIVIIFFIFAIYLWGFVSCVLLLPDVKTSMSLLARHSLQKLPGLNIAVDAVLEDDNDDDEIKEMKKKMDRYIPPAKQQHKSNPIVHRDHDPFASRDHDDDDPDVPQQEADNNNSNNNSNTGLNIAVDAVLEDDNDDNEIKEMKKKMDRYIPPAKQQHKSNPIVHRDHDPFGSRDHDHDDPDVPQQEADNNNNNNNSNSGGKSNAQTETPVPKATWPVTSTSSQPDQWLSYPHPGDGAMTVVMPPFWSPPVHDQKLMSREKALQIGSCIVPDGENYQRGTECPTNDRTIFVAIASYRDWQCKHTVTSIFKRAKYPQRVRVAVVDQIVDGDDVCNEPIEETCDTKPDQIICQYADQIDVYTMDAPLAVGPVFARHIGHRMYRGEYYAMQSDAHVTFTQDWDVDIIEQMEATGDEMTVLTTYLSDIVGSIDESNGKSLRSTRPIMCNTDYEGGPQGKHLRHMSQPERMPPRDLTMPQLQPWWAAGFSFSRGHFVVNVPYDQYQPMIFQGEEMSIGIRGFTIGYDYYAPQRSVCFHHYASMNKDRVSVPHFWENSDEYKGTGIRAMARLLGIVHMNPERDPKEWSHIEEDIYGIGHVTGRTPEFFYETFGIDVVKKKAEKNLCNFVEGGRMHRQFTPKLRSDGMGIDYSKISFKFKNRI